MNEDELLEVGTRLGEIALVIEEHFKRPQIIEGIIYEDNIYLSKSES